MGREIKRMFVYYFDGDNPVIPAEENLIQELYYNERGREIREIINDETIEFTYVMGGGHLEREVHDYPDGRREIKVYTYDWESDLVYCHIEEQMAYDGYGEIVFIPTGTYSDEWYDWSSGGKTCTRKKENHYADGTVSKELTREEYNDLGWLRRVHYYDEDFNIESFESLLYRYPEGELILKMKRSIFTTKEGERRVIRSRMRYSGERVISEEYHGVDAEGKPFCNELFNEYEDDEEGNWMVMRQLKNGKVISTVLREIEYW